MKLSGFDSVPTAKIELFNPGYPSWFDSLRISAGNRPIVALNWQGGFEKEGIQSAGMRGRSFEFFDFNAISSLRDCALLSVQVGSGSKQWLNSKLKNYFLPQQQKFDQLDSSFSSTAYLLSHSDLLITNDTSVAHLGGILGVNTWVILKKYPYWQWGEERSDNPWYPSVRCFRQKQLFCWEGAMEQVEHDLSLWLQSWRDLDHLKAAD